MYNRSLDSFFNDSQLTSAGMEPRYTINHTSTPATSTRDTHASSSDDLRSESDNPSMLTPRLLKGFAIFMHVSSKTGGLPYKWNPASKQLEFSSKFLQQFSHFRFILCASYTIFLFLRLLESTLVTKRWRISDLTLHVMFLTTYSLICLLGVSLTAKTEPTLKFLNEFFRYVAKCKPYSNGEQSSTLESILAVLTLGAGGHIIIFTIAFTAFYQKPFYLSSLFLGQTASPAFVVFFAIFELSMYLYNWELTLFYMFIVLAYPLSLKQWLFRIKRNLQILRNVKDPAKIRHTSLREYQEIRLLNDQFVHVTQPWVITGHKFVVIPMTVASSYGCLQLADKVTQPTFACYLLLMLCAVVFQCCFYQINLDVFQISLELQKLVFERVILGKRFHTKFLKTARKIPKYAGTFQIFRQWQPLEFLRKLIVTNIKIHFYIAGLVRLLRRRQ